MASQSTSTWEPTLLEEFPDLDSISIDLLSTELGNLGGSYMITL